MTKMPELGGGGGVELIRAVPKRKRALSYDVFPYMVLSWMVYSI